MKGRRRDRTDDEIERIVEMREHGKAFTEIAEALGCSAGSVQYHCLRLGIERPGYLRGPCNYRSAVVQRGDHVLRRFTASEDEQLLALEAEGLNVAEIGRAIGRRPNSVHARLMTLARRQERLEAAE